jgi:hypothetical protein
MSKGPQKAEKRAVRELVEQQKQQAAQLGQQEQQVFDEAVQEVIKGQEFLNRLMRGDRQALMQAIAPASEQSALQTQQAIRQIQQQMPRGGAEQLAEQQAQIQQGASIGNLIAQAYTGSFPSALQTGLTTRGMAPSLAYGASQAASVAGHTLGALEQAEAMGGEAKAQLFSSLASTGGYLGGRALGAPSPSPSLLLNLPVLPRDVPNLMPDYPTFGPPEIANPNWSPYLPWWLTASPPSPLSWTYTQQFGTGGF